MPSEEIHETVKQLKQFAKRWNELYAAQKFEEMKDLATEDVGIANAQESKDSSGLIYGRQAYFKGIYEAYRGSTGKEHNLLVMDYENWEYISLGENRFLARRGGSELLAPSPRFSQGSLENLPGDQQLVKHCPPRQ